MESILDPPRDGSRSAVSHVFNLLSFGVLLADSSGNPIRANPAALRLLGVPNVDAFLTAAL